MDETLHESYAKSMTRHGYGHAFYDAESTQDVYPGLCGYINESGRWVTIADVTNAKSLAQAGYTSLGPYNKMRTTKRFWGPKISNSVIRKKTHLEAQASALPAGVPVDASMIWTYSTASNFGAVLLCPSEVVASGFDQKAPFRDWAQVNAKNVLDKCKDIKKLKSPGFFVITSTYSTKEVYTTVWNNSENQVEIGVKVGVTGVGDLGPKFEYYRAVGGGSWEEADVKGGRRNVVFFGGVYFKYSRFRLGKGGMKEVNQTDWASRGESDLIFQDPEDKTIGYKVEVSEVENYNAAAASDTAEAKDAKDAKDAKV